MSTDYHTAQGDFSSIVYRLQPMVLSNFVMWLDLKVAEFKVYGQMLLDGENDINIASWFLRPGTTRDVQPNVKQKDRTLPNPARNERFKRPASSTVTRPDSVKQPRIDIGDDDEIVEIRSKSTLPLEKSAVMDNLNELQDQLASIFKSSAGPDPPKQPVRMHTVPSRQEMVKKKEQIETLSSDIPNQKSLKLATLSLSSGIPQSLSESPTLLNLQNVEKSEMSPQTCTDQSWAIENSSSELSPRLQESDTSDIITPQLKEVHRSNLHKQSSASSPSQSNSISSSFPLKPSHSLPSTKQSFEHSSLMSNSNVVVKREPVDEEFEHFECEQKFSPRTHEITREAVSNAEHSLIPESDVSLDTVTETVTKSDGSMYFVSPSDQEGQLSDEKTGLCFTKNQDPKFREGCSSLGLRSQYGSVRGRAEQFHGIASQSMQSLQVPYYTQLGSRSQTQCWVGDSSCVQKISCQICGKPFNSTGALFNHKQTVHHARVFRCDCGKVFRWNTGLARHSKRCPYRVNR